MVDVHETLTPEVKRRIKSASFIYNSLDAGSKKRFRNYQKELSRSKGVSKPLFDDKVEEVILKYAYDKSSVLEEINYLNHVRDDDGFLFSRNLKRYSKISDAMLRFSDENHPSFRWNRNYQKAKELMIDSFKRLNLTPISYNNDEDIKEVLPKLDTHSGYMYIETGFRSKGENLEGILNRFEDEVNSALASGTFNKPILIAFRTQGSGEYTDRGERTGHCKHKTRVVSMIDLIWCVAEFKFMKPFQDLISTYEFYAGGKDDDKINEKLRAWWSLSKYQKFISLDYSSYDQTISNWLMEDAYKIIASAFNMTDNEKKLWNILVHDAVHKDFILSEGLLHSNKGLPSGLPSTQILGTIVNRLITLTYFTSIQEDFKMMAMGDDNIIFCSKEVSLQEFGSYVNKNFGMIVNVDKSDEGFKGSDPKFLSRYWTVMGPWRDKYQLLSRMLFPERRRNYGLVNGQVVTPEEVVYGMLLTYRAGLGELIDTNRFIMDNPYLSKEVLFKLGTRYLPGALSYRLAYAS